ncbi:LEAF RUST 10 DISEASE-RESISTANCE LOCUS RECEPTOR-LIKE PROTEIN KINASE-like 1.2 [Cornus florida]|uniref:LEAF RUST 10 DISEASE-RESISTANCE LOCUS RECEPTOR-LIKE PROTEIN KINASE-like 1.2 n=1 Tax=Cornus florida TaxID=4283 RepID=UPI00289E1E41|nr:LEAF RUST 10 DISEASE-RESISTANCE LOCUS RECEPTOR-LIKE PROTEIN KINASE-like 1.2 [Cornus florida]
MNQKCLSTLRATSLSLSIFTFFLLLLRKALCVDPHFEECAAINKCGDQEISYPFWIEGQQKPYCGHPGFVLTCKNDTPILRIPYNDYIVKKIFYTNQSILVSNYAVLDSNNVCFPRIRNMTLEDSRFEDYKDVPMLVLYSNCSLKSPLPKELSSYKVDCDGGDGLVKFPNDASLGSWTDNCKTKVMAPIHQLSENEENEEFLGVLRRGFELKWIANNCTVCGESGGHCGFDNSSRFRCFCPDRPHYVGCARPGMLSLSL